MVNNLRLSAKVPRKRPPLDGAGKNIRNEILLSLPREEREMLMPELEFVQMKAYQVLHEPGDTIKSAFFCESGLISVLSVFADKTCVEVGLVGKEGFIGMPLLARFHTASTRAIVQLDATAFRVGSEALMSILRRCPNLERRLHQFTQIMTVQVTQIAACNRHHEVDERLARWLLMSSDRTGSDSLFLTQEFLAQMLGTRRSSVSVAAGILQKAGMIAYSRGSVTIVDRPELEEASCECYGLMQRQVKVWQADAEKPDLN